MMCPSYSFIFQVADIGSVVFRICPSPKNAFRIILTQPLTNFWRGGVYKIESLEVSVFVVNIFIIAYVVRTFKKYNDRENLFVVGS